MVNQQQLMESCLTHVVAVLSVTCIAEIEEAQEECGKAKSCGRGISAEPLYLKIGLKRNS
jgi:hypothetical protein